MLTEIIHSLTPKLSTPPSFSPISSILRHWCRQMPRFGNGMLTSSRHYFPGIVERNRGWYFEIRTPSAKEFWQIVALISCLFFPEVAVLKIHRHIYSRADPNAVEIF